MVLGYIKMIGEEIDQPVKGKDKERTAVNVVYHPELCRYEEEPLSDNVVAILHLEDAGKLRLEQISNDWAPRCK